MYKIKWLANNATVKEKVIQTKQTKAKHFMMVVVVVEKTILWLLCIMADIAAVVVSTNTWKTPSMVHWFSAWMLHAFPNMLPNMVTTYNNFC